jgi:hypothetical protein
MEQAPTRYGYWSFALLLIATGLACWAVKLQPSEKALLLAPSPEVYDFGKVRRGEFEGEFTLMNKSDKPLQILHVMLTCSCHKARVPHKTLEPGESVQGTFQWDARQEHGESQSHFSVVYRLADEPEMRYTNCVFRGNIIAPFEFEPKEFTFTLGKKEVQTATVRFWSSEIGDFAVTGATCLHPALSATCDAPRSEVIVSFDPRRWDEHDADFDHQVRVRTSSDPGFDCPVPVRFHE